ncbi:putative uroporphyrinogen decarboxylase, chloroplastic-like [Capsicum annuum]|nr:putative uroporphyrinogen decarboxylase, chloroplastic-like [Capsicum annuum]
MKRVKRFGKKVKHSPHYASLYMILRRYGHVAYELELPVDLASVHPVFHVSFLKKCISDPSLIVSLESVGVKDSHSYEEVPVEILDYQLRKIVLVLISSIGYDFVIISVPCLYAKKVYTDSFRVLKAPTLHLDENLTYENEPMAIIDRQITQVIVRISLAREFEWHIPSEPHSYSHSLEMDFILLFGCIGALLMILVNCVGVIESLLKPLPQPMLLPYSFIHFINWNSLGLREKYICKSSHYNNPNSKEEYPRPQVTQHCSESLSYDESANHVHANRKEESGSSCFQWVNFTWNQPS